MHKVLISSAGVGSRVENYSKHLNKSLITVGRKPAVAHIIDNLSDDFDEIVITLGHQKDYTKQFLKLAYPNKKITCVDVDKFEGPGAGLGYSILAAKEHLQCPFVFMPNDAITDEPIPLPLENFLGYSNDVVESFEYRTLDINTQNNKVTDVLQKSFNDETPNVYIGVAGIADWKSFWDHMEDGVESGSIEQGESYAINKMLRMGLHDFKSIKFNWHDTGNAKSYMKTNKHFSVDDKINILPKDDENIWFLNDKVIKFHIDESFIAQRVERVKRMGEYVPVINDHTNNMYSYDMVKGDTFSYNLKIDKFQSFLKWINGLWELPIETPSDFTNVCKSFYYDKTYERVNLYFSKFRMKDKTEVINGKSYPNMSTLLENVNWDYIKTPHLGTFHGDLHFENVIVDDTDNFKLIDWRQNFGGCLTVGDVYYDLAKMLHGIIMSHELVDKELYTFSVDEDEVNFDFNRKNVLVNFENIFKDFVIMNGFDYTKVRIMTALVFLNIAALHHNTYCHVLFYLGKTMLADSLEEVE